MKAMETPLRRTWAEIDLDNLAHNLAVIRRQVGEGVRLLGAGRAEGRVKVHQLRMADRLPRIALATSGLFIE